jgi:excisionase family DNA binding protein
VPRPDISSTTEERIDALPLGRTDVTRGGSNRLLTVEEVAEWLRVTPTTVRNRHRLWGLKPQKVGRLLRFRERDVATFLDEHYG